jgi:hypothetical protein
MWGIGGNRHRPRLGIGDRKAGGALVFKAAVMHENGIF